ncbi:MAG: peptidoglycan editing factor PgeF [Leptolyngbya sp. SIO1D8]|nr:peptidoglycan editing factor PgeF [Leptolyngbya sp. SIO1D8]
MINRSRQGLPYFTHASLDTYPDLVNFTTTNKGGFSNNEYGGLNVSFAVGEESMLVAKNRNLIAEVFDLDPQKLLFGRQIHEQAIRVIKQDFFKRSPEERLQRLMAVDGLITDLKDVCLCVLSADCAGILLYDPGKSVIGAIHAGWRGTVKKIATNAIHIMCHKFGCQPKDIVAVMGPCISMDSYEVGDEVASGFAEIFGEDTALIDRSYPKPHVDIAAANRQLLINSGLGPSNITLSEVCTYKSNDQFYSARRGDKGRFCSGIMLSNRNGASNRKR